MASITSSGRPCGGETQRKACFAKMRRGRKRTAKTGSGAWIA